MKTAAERIADRVKDGEDNVNRGCQAFLEAVQALNAANEGVTLRLMGEPDKESYKFNCNIQGEEPVSVSFDKARLARAYGQTGGDAHQVTLKMNEELETTIATALRQKKVNALAADLK